MKLRILSSMLVIVGTWIYGGGVANAGSTLWVPPSTCNTVNCGSMRLYANVLSSNNLTPNGMEPFLVQLMSTPSHCTRFDVTSQTTDMEIVVTAPDGTVWRNDDRTAGDLRPLVVIPPNAAGPGWYSVQIARYNGAAPVAGDHSGAQLEYGRYPSGNTNCTNPTPPALTSSAQAK